MSKELKITEDKVRKAMKVCSDAKRVLIELFADQLESEPEKVYAKIDSNRLVIFAPQFY